MNPFRNRHILYLLCLVVSLIFFTPFFGLKLLKQNILMIHMFSYFVLGIFFEIPELCLNAWCLHRSKDLQKFLEFASAFQRIVKVRYFLTHYIAPCSGIIAVTSGIALVHFGGYSFSQGWLFWILIAAMLGLYKGMNQHNFYVAQLTRFIERNSLDSSTIEELQRRIRCPFDQILIFSEFPTYMFIYFTAYYKPNWFWNPIAGMAISFERAYGAGLCGLFVLLLGGMLIPAFRWMISRWSYSYAS